MNYIQAAILGIIQGITEWIPVSSSAHLAIISRIIQTDYNLTYFVILHFATLFSLLIYFRNDFKKHFFSEKKLISKNLKLAIIASVPVFLIGFFFHNAIDLLFINFKLIGIALILNSIILLSTKFFKQTKKINFFNATFIGLMQAFALIPGISRLGITVSSGIFAKIKKDELIVFTMMLSAIAISGAGTYKLITTPVALSMPMMFGFIICFLTSFFALNCLIKTIRKNNFSKYWIYCIIMGIILLFN